jgi:ABC-type transport system involved in multi-copper enzyme maturation permease subunit
VVLIALWGVLLGMSRIPVVAQIAATPRSNRRASIALAVVLFVILMGLFVVPNYSAGQQESQDQAAANVVLAICLCVPLSLTIAFGLVAYGSPRALAEVPGAIWEGPLGWMTTVILATAAFGVIGLLVAFEPRGLMMSFSRIPFVGQVQSYHEIPATDQAVLDDPSRDPPQYPVDVAFRATELKRLVFRSSENLSVDTVQSNEFDIDPVFEVASGEVLEWTNTGENSPFVDENVTQIYVRNYSTSDADLYLTTITQPKFPEARSMLITAVAVIAVVFLYLAQLAVMPRVSAVSLSTFKSEVAQPLFMIVLVAGIVLLALFIWLPYNTFGEDIKMLKDSGMTLIMVLCIIQAVWAASTSVSDEIEGRTALTVLSKPIGRRSFIIGKYLGIFWTIAVLFAVLGLCLLICVSYKPIYDAREAAEAEATWQLCHLEVMGVVPGLVLAFMETVVLAAVSVAISTRLPMLANFIICFSIYVLGHLTPLVVQSSVSMFEPVRFVAELVATVLPNLDHFNIQAAVAAGVSVPYDYLGWSLVYCLIYGVIALMLALVLFEDRDLA